MLRQGKAFAVDFFENNIAAPTQQGLAHFLAELHWIIALSNLSQNFRSIWMRHQSVQSNACLPLTSANAPIGHLATAAQFVQQRAFAGGGGARGSIIQKGE